MCNRAEWAEPWVVKNVKYEKKTKQTNWKLATKSSLFCAPTRIGVLTSVTAQKEVRGEKAR